MLGIVAGIGRTLQQGRCHIGFSAKTWFLGKTAGTEHSVALNCDLRKCRCWEELLEECFCNSSAQHELHLNYWKLSFCNLDSVLHVLLPPVGFLCQTGTSESLSDLHLVWPPNLSAVCTDKPQTPHKAGLSSSIHQLWNLAMGKGWGALTPWFLFPGWKCCQGLRLHFSPEVSPSGGSGGSQCLQPDEVYKKGQWSTSPEAPSLTVQIISFKALQHIHSLRSPWNPGFPGEEGCCQSRYPTLPPAVATPGAWCQAGLGGCIGDKPAQSPENSVSPLSSQISPARLTWNWESF